MMNHNKLLGYEEAEQIDKQINLDQIKLKVTLSNLQLLQLTSKDQKFIATLHSYNKAGVQNLINGNYETALIYLQQAQKILQYSASCGKTIDRFLIIVTLQNQAAAYQKLWQLQKSSDYMEAILYNMNSYLQTSSPIQMSHEIRNHNSQSHKLFSIFISKRMDSVVYNLQYSAVSSQIGKHDIALRSAKKSLQIMSIILTELYSYECFIKNWINKSSPLKVLRDSCRGFKNIKSKVSIKNMKQKLKNLRNMTYDQQIENNFKSFSIGDVMQIEPIQFKSKVKQITFQIQKLQIVKKVLYVSISYYAMATQLRLLSASCSLHDEKAIKKQNKKSKFYHMNAINIALDHIPCVTEYLQYIIKSFKNNYQIDLDQQIQDDHESDQDFVLSNYDQESFQIKQQESYRIQNNISTAKKQADNIYPQSRNSSIDKKKSISGRQYFTQSKGKTTKLKKLYKLQSSTSLKLTQYKPKTIRQQSKKRDEKKQKQKQKQKQHSRSRKSLSNVKSSKIFKNPLKRIQKKKSRANSTQKTKDQTKKYQEKRKSQTKKISQEYLTAKKDKTKQKDKKKKTKINGQQSRKKIVRVKTPVFKATKSPFLKN